MEVQPRLSVQDEGILRRFGEEIDRLTAQEQQHVANATYLVIAQNWRGIVSFFAGNEGHALHIPFPDSVERRLYETVPKLAIENVEFRCKISIDNLMVSVTNRGETMTVYIEVVGQIIRDRGNAHHTTLLGKIRSAREEMQLPRVDARIRRAGFWLEEQVFKSLIERNFWEINEHYRDEQNEELEYEINLENTTEGYIIYDTFARLGFDTWFVYTFTYENYSILIKKDPDEFKIAISLGEEFVEQIQQN